MTGIGDALHLDSETGGCVVVIKRRERDEGIQETEALGSEKPGHREVEEGEAAKLYVLI